MHLGLSNGVVAGACIILIILLLLVYLRSRQGDQRIINATNAMFLPLLSALLITLGVIFNNSACSSNLSGLKYITTIIAILIILIGAIRFILSHSRDRRLITHPVLFAIIIVLAVFAIQQLFACGSV